MLEPKDSNRVVRLITQEVNAMTVNITSKQMDITPAIRAHVEERLAKLDKWQTQLINPHFILNKTPKGFFCGSLYRHAER